LGRTGGEKNESPSLVREGNFAGVPIGREGDWQEIRKEKNLGRKPFPTVS